MISISILLLIIIPLVVAFLIPLLDLYNKLLRRYLVIIGGVIEISISIYIIISYFSDLKAGKFFLTYYLGGWGPPFGINLVMDSVSLIFSSLISFALFFIIIYSIGFIGHHEGKYYVLFFLILGAMQGAILTGDMFNLYVFIELLTVTSAPLVAFKRNKHATEAAIKYMFYGVIGGLFFFVGVILLYFNIGSLNMAQLAQHFAEIENNMQLTIISIFLIGLLIKIGIFPFHFWLPKAHSACPSSLSALLSGVLLKVYLYIFIRLFWIVIGFEFLLEFNIASFLVYLALVSSLFGHVFALQASDIKRMLAFSSIGHIGMILAVFLLNTETGFYGGLLHIISHLLMKTGLFLSTGYLLQYTKSNHIDDFAGVGHQNKGIFVGFILLTLSMIGMPPFIGFFSKWYIIMAFLKIQHHFGAIVVVLGSLSAVFYYLRFIAKGYEKIKLSASDLKNEIYNRPILSVFYREKLVTTVIYIFVGMIILTGFSFRLFELPLQEGIKELINPQNYINLILGG